MSDLDPRAERELLELLDEALVLPRASRRSWLTRKLKERAQVGRKLEDLLALAERNNVDL